MDAEIKVPLDNLPNNDQEETSALSADQHGLMRELIVIGVVLLLLIPAIWVALTSETEEEIEQRRIEIKIAYDNHILAAQKQLSRDHLSWPEEANALHSYLEALELKENSKKAREGLARIGDRYIEIIRHLLDNHELDLLKTTVAQAQNVNSSIESAEFDRQLKELTAQSKQLQEQFRENNQARLNSNPDAYTPRAILQDPLKSGALGPRMVVVPAGHFTLGSPPTEAGRDSDEGPQVKITLPSFAIGQSEVTFADYKAFLSATNRAIPDDMNWGQGERPVINISWREARDYTAWLTQQTGFLYRLPTEAEWEYAARAGTTTPFANGKCLSSKQANLDASVTEAYAECLSDGSSQGKTIEVATLEPNPWGLYNVHGNVREWVRDCWVTSYENQPSDGSAVFLAEGGGCSVAGGKRVLRGGDWSSTLRTSRVANRYAVDEFESNAKYGFRLLRELK